MDPRSLTLVRPVDQSDPFLWAAQVGFLGVVYLMSRWVTWLAMFAAVRPWKRRRESHWTVQARLSWPGRRVGASGFPVIVLPVVFLLASMAGGLMCFLRSWRVSSSCRRFLPASCARDRMGASTLSGDGIDPAGRPRSLDLQHFGHGVLPVHGILPVWSRFQNGRQGRVGDRDLRCAWRRHLLRVGLDLAHAGAGRFSAGIGRFRTIAGQAANQDHVRLRRVEEIELPVAMHSRLLAVEASASPKPLWRS